MWSMSTGHAWTHAMQVVHSQRVWLAMTLSTSGWSSSATPSRLSPLASKASRATAACFPGGVPPLAWYFRSTMKSRGFRSFSVAYAGQASWQRPHSMQVRRFSRSVQARSRTLFQPYVSPPSKSSSASRSMKSIFWWSSSCWSTALNGAPRMWKCLDVGT